LIINKSNEKEINEKTKYYDDLRKYELINYIIPLLDPLTIISTIEIWVIWVIILCEDKKITNLCVVRGFTALLKV